MHGLCGMRDRIYMFDVMPFWKVFIITFLISFLLDVVKFFVAKKR